MKNGMDLIENSGIGTGASTSKSSGRVSFIKYWRPEVEGHSRH
jgi:hypothetical protein